MSAYQENPEVTGARPERRDLTVRPKGANYQ